MNNDFLDPINAENMPHMADGAFAMDFLLTVKTGVRTCAAALAETVNPQVRALLHRQLTASLALHTAITELMQKQGWLNAYKLNEQFSMDMRSAETVAKIAQMDLFPKDTSRLGTFATPNK